MIEINNLSKNYFFDSKIKPVLKNIDLTISDAEFLMIMGDNGSGKTTLLNCISGFDTITEGEIKIDDVNYSKLKRHEIEEFRLHKFGFIFQDSYLIDNLTVLENIALSCLQYDKDANSKAEELLLMLKIEDLKDSYPSQISGGEKQKCAIARAIINNPSILFADEPTASLDENASKEIINILLNLNKKGQTILMVTHSADMASYGSKIVFIKDGILKEKKYLQKEDSKKNINRETKLKGTINEKLNKSIR